jgi:hypothetical protein
LLSLSRLGENGRQVGKPNPGNGFYIGTGNAMAAKTYFSGMIDDVRIYNRAVSP